MAVGGILGNGVKIGFSAASPVNWTRIGQLLDQELPGLNPDEVETTQHSTTSNLKRFIRGLVDVSELKMTILMDLDEATSAAQDQLWQYQHSSTTIWWRIEVPTTRTKDRFVAFEFQGWVKSFLPKAPIADKQTLEVTVRFDGESLGKYAAGASAIT